MKYLIATFAAAALLFVTAQDSFAQKGFGKGGAPSHGWGHTQHGHHGYGYPHYYGHLHHGHHGHHGHGGHIGHGDYWRAPYDLGAVPYYPSPAYNPGPLSPTVTYPYYTTRGPRDFLMANPPTIGPR